MKLLLLWEKGDREREREKVHCAAVKRTWVELVPKHTDWHLTVPWKPSALGIALCLASTAASSNGRISRTHHQKIETKILGSTERVENLLAALADSGRLRLLPRSCSLSAGQGLLAMY